MSAAQTTIAITVANTRISHSGMPGEASRMTPMMVQLVSAPTMSTSPCAKLISPMMPYTMV
ncbi:hypothetical protein D9M69_701380 [compost metagenome]